MGRQQRPRRGAIGSWLRLEDRVTPAVAIDALGNLVIDASDGQANAIRISVSGTNDYVISDGSGISRGTNSISIPINLVTGSHIYVNTGDGDDTFTVDFSGGSFAHKIVYDGGDDFDDLVLTGGSFDTITHDYVNAHSGRITVDSNHIAYSHIEPIDQTGTTAGHLVFNLPTAASNVTLGDDGTPGNGMSRISSSPATFETTTFANPASSLTINRGHAADTLTIAELPDFNGALTVGTSAAPIASVTVSGAATLAPDRGFTVFASGAIGFSTTNSDWTTSGSGAIALTTTQNISLSAGSSLATVHGDITLSANWTTATPGNFIGIDVNGGTIGSATGGITLFGRGGFAATTNLNGVSVREGGQVGVGTIGTVRVSGQGGTFSGPSTASSDTHGVRVFGDASQITSGGGDVEVIGTGGFSVSGLRYGVWVDLSGAISAGGTGNVAVTGTGDALGVRVDDTNSKITSNGGNVFVKGTGSQTSGVSVAAGEISAAGLGNVTVTSTNGSVRVNVGGRVTSSGGNVEIMGTGHVVGGAASSSGVVVGSGLISSGGMGSVKVIGTGGSGGGGSNYGVWVAAVGAITSDVGDIEIVGLGGNGGDNNRGVTVHANGRITSGGGSVKITGTGGEGPTSFGVVVRTDGQIVGTNGTPVTIVADSMNFESPTSISAPGSVVTLRPRTAGTLINLGGADVVSGSPLTLGLTDAELDLVNAGTLVIGDAASGAVTISNAITRPAPTNMQLVSGGDVVLNNSFNTAGGNLLLGPGTTGAVKPAFAGTDVSAGIASFAGDLTIAINGNVPNTQYDVLTVAGTVDLTGVDLVLTGSFVPAIGNTFAIVAATNRTGTFANLPTNGSTINFNGVPLAVNYTPTGATLTATNVGTTVADVRIGDGVNNIQRSRVTQIVVAFDQVIGYVGAPTTAYTLQRIVGGVPTGSPVNISVSTVTVGTHSEATITFNDNVLFGSLIDGRYRLTVNAGQIPGMASNHVVDFHRHYGDYNGDVRVDGADFSAFVSTYNLSPTNPNFLAVLDFNNDGRIDGFDFGQFAARFNVMLPP